MVLENAGEKNKSSNGERFTQVQFLRQRSTDNGTYDLNISQNEEKSSIRNTILPDAIPYGFTYEEKIYLNPDIVHLNASEKNKSSNGELESKVQFLGQRITDNGTYDLNISQNEEKSSIRNMFLPDGITYGFTYKENLKAFLERNISIEQNKQKNLIDAIDFVSKNVLDNYDDIYKDPENNTVVFVKQEGRLNDFVVVEQKNNKLVFYDSTFFRKGIPSRFEK
ncbi:MAG: hypothetical protein ACI4LX_01470 [Treponema sp.]